LDIFVNLPCHHSLIFGGYFGTLPKLNIKKQNDKSKVKKRAYQLAPAVTGFVKQLPKGWASAAISDKLLCSKEHKSIFLHFYRSF
jgi:hypothetical protein